MAWQATRRRRSDESVHDYQHELIEERKIYWRSLPRRSQLDRVRRREAEKQSWWTLTGHLRSQHSYKGGFMRMTYDEATALHTQLHEGEPK